MGVAVDPARCRRRSALPGLERKDTRPRSRGAGRRVTNRRKSGSRAGFPARSPHDLTHGSASVGSTKATKTDGGGVRQAATLTARHIGGERVADRLPGAAGTDGTCRIAARRLRSQAGPLAAIVWLIGYRATRGRRPAHSGSRLRRPRRDAGATGHSARGRDAGERRDAERRRWVSTCRIATGQLF